MIEHPTISLGTPLLSLLIFNSLRHQSDTDQCTYTSPGHMDGTTAQKEWRWFQKSLVKVVSSCSVLNITRKYQRIPGLKGKCRMFTYCWCSFSLLIISKGSRKYVTMVISDVWEVQGWTNEFKVKSTPITLLWLKPFTNRELSEWIWSKLFNHILYTML